ncbi:MAG TPA: hypothetical protein VD758_10005, partial [Gemmatimonadaceae bacterium]|nr:hypothetical protein [Gemmatimonadaceae bacterium]
MYISAMKKYVVSLLAIMAAGSSAYAQETGGPGACTTPDTVMIAGNSRVSDATIRASAGLPAHTTLNFRDVQRAIKALFTTGQFEDIQISCSI